jgi:riboflavin synthase
MFTGIIAAVGTVSSVSRGRGRNNLRVSIGRPRGWSIAPGDSININGVCSTVSRLTAKTFDVEYMPETLKITTVPMLTKGARVNLERSLKVSDRLDGHFVQGHVDTTGTVLSVARADTNDAAVVKIAFPQRYKKFIAKKGSVCVNGVSLTVVETGAHWFSVSLVSYTLNHTTMQNLAKNDKVNIEIDMLARYLEALLAKK